MTITRREASANAGTRKYLRADELAERWGVAPKTLAKWRCDRTGPRYVKLSNGLVRYPVTEIDAFELAASEG